MYHPLSTKLALDSTGSQGPPTDYSQPVQVGLANAAQIEVVVSELEPDWIDVMLQGSNDLENWSDIGTTRQAALGYNLLATETGVGTAYVRARSDVNGNGVAVLSVGMNLSNQ